MSSIIHLLSDTTISRIAAGEVIERPASVVKELVENSIDAESTNIHVIINNGGRNLISVSDNGKGMSKEDLKLCVERHATSKLNDEDIFDINFLGFRGEAIPSIGSVSRMSIISKTRDSDTAYGIRINGGEKSEIFPSTLNQGTKIEIRDLFFATPARLKFLKSENTETQYIYDIIVKLALCYPKIGFILSTEKKTLLTIKENSANNEEVNKERLKAIMGQDFIDNSLIINLSRDNMKVTGYAAIPTYNKGTANSQFMFVNNRPVKDKLIIGAIRASYRDYLAINRYPVVIIFVEVPQDELDVNVHPTKAEVRFRYGDKVRGIIISALNKALAQGTNKASTTVANQAIAYFKKDINIHTENTISPLPLNQNLYQKSTNLAFEMSRSIDPLANIDNLMENFNATMPSSVNLTSFTTKRNLSSFLENKESQEEIRELPPTNSNQKLGMAHCQLHETYIIAQTENSIIIVDQHAAHERLVYEKMKIQLAQKKIVSQRLLIPEIIELDAIAIENIMTQADLFKSLGLTIETFGDNAIIVRETPALLGNVDIKLLIQDLLSELAEHGKTIALEEAIEHICSRIACHGSIRAGRLLNREEMNSLLREMEVTPYSGQCNHGRPTYLELNLKDIEKLFGRR